MLSFRVAARPHAPLSHAISALVPAAAAFSSSAPPSMPSAAHASRPMASSATAPAAAAAAAAEDVELTSAVSPTGALLVPAASDPVLEVARPHGPNTRELRLNRPNALHSLTADMALALHNRLRALRRDPAAACLLLTSSTPGRALCAGGDIRALHKHGRHPATLSRVDAFFRAEYSLCAALSRHQLPPTSTTTTTTTANQNDDDDEEKERSPCSYYSPVVVPILDGVTMGGGVGIVQHGPVRVATERTVWAMPECAIGLHPDIGASHFLARLGPLGRYLALTGARAVARDVVRAGLASHFVPSARVPALVERLAAHRVPTAAEVVAVLDEFARGERRKDGDGDDGRGMSASPFGAAGDAVIEQCFSQERVEDVVQALNGFVDAAASPPPPQKHTEEEVAFAKDALDRVQAACPLSLKVAAEAQRRARSLTLPQSLQMEYRLTARFVRGSNFYEGVRAALIDRGDTPQWEPATLAEVKDEDVESMFAPLDDIGIPELDVDDDGALESPSDGTTSNESKL